MRRLVGAVVLALGLLLVQIIGRPGSGSSTPADRASALSSLARIPATTGSPSAAALMFAPALASLPGPLARHTSGHSSIQRARRPSAPTRVLIVIPRLGVRAPVYDRGIDASGHLPIAPGYAITHLQLSAVLGQPGNYVVYGHDDIEGEVLRYLPSMRDGDRIDLFQGTRRYRYIVTGRRLVPPTAVEVLDATLLPTLTLISCTPYMVDTQRIVVTASLAEVTTLR